jgi:hypothetical protein
MSAKARHATPIPSGRDAAQMAEVESDVLYRLAVDRLAEHDNDLNTAFEAYRADAWPIYNEDYDGTREEFGLRAAIAFDAALNETIPDVTDEPPDPPQSFAVECLHEVYIRRSDLLPKAQPAEFPIPNKIAISKEALQEQRKQYERYREYAALVLKSPLERDLRDAMVEYTANLDAAIASVDKALKIV